MAIKSSLLCAIVFVISFTSTESSFICDVVKLGKGECNTCDFLTFGQENMGFGVSFFCPQTPKSGVEKYCCYNMIRQPYCCDQQSYVVNGLLWFAAVIAGIYVITKLVRCLIF